MTRQKAPIAAVGETWAVVQDSDPTTEDVWYFKIVYVERRRGKFFYLAIKLDPHSRRPILNPDHGSCSVWFDSDGDGNGDWLDFILLCPLIDGRWQVNRATKAGKNNERRRLAPPRQPLSDEERAAVIATLRQPLEFRRVHDGR